MADKFRKTAPLKVTFSEGEQPTAEKLTVVANQTRNGLGQIEKVVGDTWNQSGDVWTVDSALQIPNLARAIGQMEYLNPAIYPGEQVFEFAEHIGDRHVNRTTGHFLFTPNSGTTFRQVIDVNGNFVTEVAEEYMVLSTGQFWVDYETGRFRVFDVIDATDVIAYDVNPTAADGWVVGEETLPNIIPDPGHATMGGGPYFLGCRVSSASGKYYLHLPPRQPINLATRETPSRYPSSTEFQDDENLATSMATPYKWWQKGSTAALTGANSEHYRYRLPKEIQDEFGSQAQGEEYPQGYLYLWDQSTNMVIEGVRFYKPTNSELTGGSPDHSVYQNKDYVIEVDDTDADIDLSTYLSTNDSSASFDTGLTLIVCGSPITRTLWTLAAAFYRHGHRNDGTLEDTVSHNNLTDLNPPTSVSAEHPASYPSSLPPWSASKWANDPHTSLLSRAGAQSSAKRDVYNNAMLGDFILANNDPANYLAGSTPSASGSFGLWFGDLSTGYVVKQMGSSYGAGEAGLLISKAGSTSLGFSLSPDGGTAYFGINPAGGNISERVLVRGANKQVTIWNSVANNKAMTLYTESGGHSWISNANNFQGNASSDSNTWMNIGGQSGVYLRYGPNSGTVGFTLDSAGKVGIGTTPSTERLRVDGGIVLTSTSGPHVAGSLGFTDSNWGFLYRPPQAGSLGAHLFEKYDGSHLMVIQESGNAGIGTSSPASAHRLEVYKSGATWCELGLVLESGTFERECIINFGEDNTTAERYVGRLKYRHADNSMRFWTNGAERMLLDSSGNLTVASGANATASFGKAFIGQMTGGASGYAGFGHVDQNAYNECALLHSPTGYTVLNAASGQSINFRIANATQWSIDSSGNLSNSGNGQLRVSGGVFPNIVDVNDTDTGIDIDGLQVGFYIGGVRRGYADTNGIRVPDPYKFQAESSAHYDVRNDTAVCSINPLSVRSNFSHGFDHTNGTVTTYSGGSSSEMIIPLKGVKVGDILEDLNLWILVGHATTIQVYVYGKAWNSTTSSLLDSNSFSSNFNNPQLVYCIGSGGVGMGDTVLSGWHYWVKLVNSGAPAGWGMTLYGGYITTDVQTLEASGAF